MENDSKKKCEVKPFRRLRWPLTPYQLFSPVSSVFLNNITQEEQILGLYKRFNEFGETYNTLIKAVDELQKMVDPIPDQIKEIQEAFNTLSTVVQTKLLEIINLISTTASATLKASQKYTDEQIATHWRMIAYGALTAEEYDSLQFTADQYDQYQMTAIEYDTKAKWILFGQEGAIYYKYIKNITVNRSDVVFDLSNPPVKPGRRYKLEIGLGGSNSDANAIIKFRINNVETGSSEDLSLIPGATTSIPITFRSAPTQITYEGVYSNNSWNDPELYLYNIYVKIIPLGELK